MQIVPWNEEITEKNPIFPGKLQIYFYENLKKKTTFHFFIKKEQE